MKKVEVSKFWTNEERLALIDLIVQTARGKEVLLTPWQMMDIHVIASQPSTLLEANRSKFAAYLEVPL